MILTLDTNVVVELVRGKRPFVRDRFFQALATERVMVASLFVLSELYLGCGLHPNPVAELKRVQAILSHIRIEVFDEADVISAAKVRATLRKQGTPIGPYDALIAGQALARDWTVVTANAREFSHVDGLNVIDWTAPAD